MEFKQMGILFLCILYTSDLRADEINTAFNGYNYERPDVGLDFNQTPIEANLSLDEKSQNNFNINQQAQPFEDIESFITNEDETQHIIEPENESAITAAELKNETAIEQPKDYNIFEDSSTVISHNSNTEQRIPSTDYIGYHYNQPEIIFTLPPPLPEQLVLETTFVHQELGSQHKSHHQGHVHRLKPSYEVANDISSCDKDWRQVVKERSLARPKRRRPQN